MGVKVYNNNKPLGPEEAAEQNAAFVRAMLSCSGGVLRCPGALASYCAVDGQNLPPEPYAPPPTILAAPEPKPQPPRPSGKVIFYADKKTRQLPPGRTLLVMASKAFKTPVDEIKSASRVRKLAHIRYVIMYVAYEKTRLNLVAIGKLLGGRDHSTILHGIHRVKENPDTYAAMVRKLEARL